MYNYLHSLYHNSYSSRLNSLGYGHCNLLRQALLDLQTSRKDFHNASRRIQNSYITISAIS